MSIEILQSLKYQKQNRFEFYFLDNADIKYRVLTVNLPRESFEYTKTKAGENTLTGITFPDTVTLSILETKDFYLEDFVESWRDVFYDKDTRIFKSLPVENADKKTGVLVLFDEKGLINRTYIYNNLSLVGLSESTFDYGNPDLLSWELVMKVEDVSRI